MKFTKMAISWPFFKIGSSSFQQEKIYKIPNNYDSDNCNNDNDCENNGDNDKNDFGHNSISFQATTSTLINPEDNRQTMIPHLSQTFPPPFY